VTGARLPAMSVKSAAYKPPELGFFCLECGEQEF
jgi:hypothetical protein